MRYLVQLQSKSEIRTPCVLRAEHSIDSYRAGYTKLNLNNPQVKEKEDTFLEG